MSKDVFEELRASRRLASLKGIPGVATLRQLVPQRLADVYRARAGYSHHMWRTTRDISDLDDSYSELEKFNQIHPNTYQYRLSKAMWLFVAKHDVAGAIRVLEKSAGESDATWRYSLAFLYAYQGKLDEADWQYRKAFTRPCEQSVPFEIEEFMEWVLGQEPDKFQLNYCIGLVNWFAKGDKQRAAKDLEVFVAHKDVDQFPNASQRARQLIQEFKNMGEMQLSER